MPINELTTDLNHVQALTDRPNANEGMTAAEVKATFDQAGNQIKTFINSSLIVDINATFEPIADLTTNRKLSATGDFTGTLNGQPITATDPGLSSAVAGLLAETATDMVNVKNAYGAVGDWNGTTGTDDTAAIQAAINANPGKVLLLDTRFKITTPLTIGATSGTSLVGLTDKSEIVLISATTGIAAINIIPATTYPSHIRHAKIKNLIITANTANDQQSIGFHSTATNQIMLYYDFEDLELFASGYCLDWSDICYTGMNVIRNVYCNGGGALKITPYAGTTYFPHTTSGLVIDNFHYSGSNKVGAAMHLVGCKETQMTTPILEGSCTMRSDLAAAYAGAVYLYIEAPSYGMRISGLWQETTGSWSTNAKNSIFHGSTAGSNGDCHVTITEPHWDTQHASSLTSNGVGNIHVTIEGIYMVSSTLFDAVPANTFLTLKNCQFLNVASMQAYGNLARINLDKSYVYNSAGGNTYGIGMVINKAEPVRLLYQYRGGYMSNDIAQTVPYSGYAGAGLHYPQQDPYCGATILIARGAESAYIWRKPLLPFFGLDVTQLMGKVLYVYVEVRFPHLSTTLTNLPFQQNTLTGYTATVTAADAWTWKPMFATQIISGSETELKFPDFQFNSAPYLQIRNMTISIGEIAPPYNQTKAECYDEGLTSFLGSWIVGETVKVQTPVSGGFSGSKCTTAGTNRTISVTGSITTGTAILNTVSDLTKLIPGDYITIAGVTGIKRVLSISGTTAILDSNANATVSGAAVANSAAVFKTYGAIS